MFQLFKGSVQTNNKANSLFYGRFVSKWYVTQLVDSIVKQLFVERRVLLIGAAAG